MPVFGGQDDRRDRDRSRQLRYGRWPGRTDSIGTGRSGSWPQWFQRLDGGGTVDRRSLRPPVSRRLTGRGPPQRNCFRFSQCHGVRTIATTSPLSGTVTLEADRVVETGRVPKVGWMTSSLEKDLPSRTVASTGGTDVVTLA